MSPIGWFKPNSKKTPAPPPVTAEVRQVERVLCRAHDLVDKRWTTGSYAKDGSGYSVQPSSKAAVTFCSVGAVQRAAHELQVSHGHVFEEALKRLATKMDPTKTALDEQTAHSTVVRFNDMGATHEDVVGAFCGSIKTLREEYGMEKPTDE